jgi:hypothetical protein
LCAVLAGCATDGAVIHEAPTNVVEKQVRVPCVDAVKIPAVPAKPHAKPDADEKQESAAIAAYVVAFEEYAELADGLLRACSK